MKLRDKLNQFIKSDEGDGFITFLFIALICMIFAVIAVNVIQYNMIKSNMKTAANETLQIMKVENGADITTKEKFDDLLRKMGSDPAAVTFTATPKQVQRGDFVEITATREYNVFALKAIGVNYNITITVHVSGLAHKFIRQGG